MIKTFSQRSVFLIALFFIPLLASAHTRWFAEGEIPPLVTQEPTSLYLAGCFLLATFVVFVGTVLEKKKLFRLDFLRPRTVNAFNRVAATFTMVAGAFFMIAGTHEYLFSPNLTVHSGVPMLLIMVQFVIGLMFLLGIFARLGAVLLAIVWFLALPYAGLEALVENIWVLSIISFIIIMGNDYFSVLSIRSIKGFVYKFRPYALPTLRVGTGITLVTLGFTEKIFRPELGLNFLAQHDWNFLASFGVSDYLFVLLAGTTEALLGLLLLLGITTRLVAVVTAIIFTIPLFILGPIELTGHLPHFAAIIIIIMFGAGHHFRLFDRMSKNS
ncbi:MAG: DoxX family membrane protein [Candidatus Paceibacterota bacterium]